MISISFFETKVLLKLVTPFFTISFIFLALVPIIGIEVNGAKRWIDLYFFRLQPIEMVKPFFILMTVKILTLKKLQNSQLKYFFSFILLSSVIILLIDQPDLGQSILLICSWIATVFISGVSLTYIIIFFFNFSDLIKFITIFFTRKIWIYHYSLNKLF